METQLVTHQLFFNHGNLGVSQSVAQLHQVLYVTSNEHYIFKFQNSRAFL